MIHSRRSILLLTCLLALACALPLIAAPSPLKLRYPDMANAIVRQPTRGGSGLWKLDVGLLDLYYQYLPAGRRHRQTYSPAQLKSRFGITTAAADPAIGVAVVLVPGTPPSTVRSAIGAPLLTGGDRVYASVHVLSLPSLAGQDWVQAIGPLKPAARPSAPRFARRTGHYFRTRGAAENAADFDHQSLTGAGVIVGLIDSGLDFRHKDFVKPDGTTRILALWDMTDDSYAKSHGKIGSAPPYEVDDKPLGTVYTQGQLNAALKGDGVVNSVDNDGHGTACTGIAASGSSTYPGVAPDSDILFVKAGNTGVNQYFAAAAKWIVDEAGSAHEPVVISMSFGSMDTSHDGYDENETALDSLAGPNIPGVAFCAAAGNDGHQTAHAGGRFGPKREGQEDIFGDPVQLFVTKDTAVEAFFSASDEWGLAISGDSRFLPDSSGKPNAFFLEKVNGKLRADTASQPASEAAFKKLFDATEVGPAPNDKEDELLIPLPPGNYTIAAYGASAKVSSGQYDLYLPFPDDASFGSGSDGRCLVASPGNASEVITVGAYNFRKSWLNFEGSQTNYNLELGDLASYSSPGYRRDGVVKPDLVAPASFAISTLASGSEMGKTDGGPDTLDITSDGKHIAWCGTSAACPYVAGVIALMLQKDPGLTQNQIEKILTKTATSDQFTGAVPNPSWGYGKIDPAGALAKTSAGAK